MAIALAAVAILWTFYGFRYAARPGGNQIVPATAAYLQSSKPPLRTNVCAFAERHRLLPESYLYGLTDILILAHGAPTIASLRPYLSQQQVVLLPAAFLVKATLGLMLLLALVPFARPLWRRPFGRELAFLILPPAVYFGIAMRSKMDMGICHVLPIMPFLVVLAAAGTGSTVPPVAGLGEYGKGLVLFRVGSSLWAFPNYLRWSGRINPGGPSQTYRSVSDANAGWGRRAEGAARIAGGAHITRCWFAYSAPPDPAGFQIPCKRLPTYFSTLLGYPQPEVPVRIDGPVFIQRGRHWALTQDRPRESRTTTLPACGRRV